MIIDKDRWKNIPEIITLCKQQRNMYVAGSNPCFEFWLLLHVITYSDISQEDRTNLLENKRVSNKKNFIDRFLGQFIDGYNKKNLRPERFIPNIAKAIEQAKELDAPNEEFPSRLGSHIYKIVQKLVT